MMATHFSLTRLIAIAAITTLCACSAKVDPVPTAATTSGNGAGAGAAKKTISTEASVAEKKELTKEEQIEANKSLVDLVHNYEELTADEKLEKIEKAIAEGADVNSKNAFGEPVILDAIHYGDGSSDDLRVAELLLEKGANVAAYSEETGRSSMTKAVESGNMQAVELLFKYEFDIKSKPATHGLVTAAYLQNREIVDYLLGKGIEADQPYKDALFTAPSAHNEAWAALAGMYADMKIKLYRAVARDNNPANSANLFRQHWLSIQESCLQIDRELNEVTLALTDDRKKQIYQGLCQEYDQFESAAYGHCHMLTKSKAVSIRRIHNHLSKLAAEIRAMAPEAGEKFAAIKSAQELGKKHDEIRYMFDVYQDVVIAGTRQAARVLQWHKPKNQRVRLMANRCQKSLAFKPFKMTVQETDNINRSLTKLMGDTNGRIIGFQKERSALVGAHKWLKYQHPALQAYEYTQKKEAEAKRAEARRDAEEERKIKEPQPVTQPPEADEAPPVPL